MIEVNHISTRSEVSGRSIYEREIRERLTNIKLNVVEYIPSKIHIKGVSLIAKAINRLLWLPYQVKRGVKKDSINHLTSEDLAYLLNFIKLEKTVVNCHDLIHWVYYKRRYSPFWRLNIKGLKKADRIITVSNFSKNDIIKYLGYPKDKITVIHDAVDHNHYYQKRDKEILKRYNISKNERVILYVGTEQPRQNVPFLMRGFAELKKLLPRVRLLKIGNPQWPGAREKLQRLTRELNLQNDVIFIGYVTEKELPKWYNAADLFVYPCLYAGFGIPPLEAMACGTPVITSNLTSFPEVVGNAGVMVNPYDRDQLVKAMHEVLTNRNLRENMIKKGLQRAKMFSWEKSAEKTLELYKVMAAGK